MSQPSDAKRKLEYKEKKIPKQRRDSTFSEDKRDPHRLIVPPQKYREWLVSQKTRREAHEALPLYRIPQQAYLLDEYKKNPHKWSRDAEKRLYKFVPREDEAFKVLGRDVRSNEWFLYVVLTEAKAEFPRDMISIQWPFPMVLKIDFSDFQQDHAVGLVKAKRQGPPVRVLG